MKRDRINSVPLNNRFNYTLLEMSDRAFLFKVECRGNVFYELIKNTQHARHSEKLIIGTSLKEQIWSTYNYSKAIKKFNEVQKGGK